MLYFQLLNWWALLESNQRPPPCEGDALPLSQAPNPGGHSVYRTETLTGKMQDKFGLYLIRPLVVNSR